MYDQSRGRIDWCFVLQTCFVLHAVQNIIPLKSMEACRRFWHFLLHAAQNMKTFHVFSNDLCFNSVDITKHHWDEIKSMKNNCSKKHECSTKHEPISPLCKRTLQLIPFTKCRFGCTFDSWFWQSVMTDKSTIFSIHHYNSWYLQ